MVYIMVVNLFLLIKLSFLFRSKYVYCKLILNYIVIILVLLFYDINRIILCFRF